MKMTAKSTFMDEDCITAKKSLIFWISNHTTVQMKKKNLLCQGRNLNPYFCMTPDLNKILSPFGYVISPWPATPPFHVVPDFLSQICIPLEDTPMLSAGDFFVLDTKMQNSTLWHQFRFWHHLRLQDVNCTNNALRLISSKLAWIPLALTLMLSPYD